MKLPNIIYFGSDAICLPGLNFLINEASDKCVLRAVISQPDRPQGRGRQLQPNPVAAWAAKSGIELLQPEKPTSELVDWVKDKDIRVGLVMAYGHFLQKSLRKAPQYGLLNFHGSLLPQYRGASPVETALACGDSRTGVSLMQVARKMDAGDVADMEIVPIGETVVASGLRSQVGEAVVTLLRRNLNAMLAGELNFQAQDASQATYCRKFCKADGAVDFSLSAAEIYNRLRAFTPWPGGYFDHGNKRIKIGSASALPDIRSSARPGTVVDANSAVRVATGDGLICFHELQLPGSRMLPVADFIRGYSMTSGDYLVGGAAEDLVR